MFNNLLAELARNDMTRKGLAAYIGIHENTMKKKLSGGTEFTKTEMEKICQRLNVFDVWYLFGSDLPANMKNTSQDSPAPELDTA